MNHRMRAVVRRGSHVHHTPQEWRPQIAPVMSVSVQQSMPISTEAAPYMSYFRSRRVR